MCRAKLASVTVNYLIVVTLKQASTYFFLCLIFWVRCDFFVFCRSKLASFVMWVLGLIGLGKCSKFFFKGLLNKLDIIFK